MILRLITFALFAFCIPFSGAYTQNFADYGIEAESGKKLKPLEVGTQAPAFKGVDQEAKLVSLDKLTSAGPLVMIFYRGEWCPVCNRYLEDFQDKLDMILDMGANVVAVTPEGEFYRKSTVRKAGIKFPVIIDKDMSIMNDYGVAFNVSESYQSKVVYALDTDIAEVNQQDQAVLPVPATYIIGQDGKIKWVHFNIDYKERASIEDIKKALESL